MEKEIIIANRYLIIKKIGEGGTAKVYLAHDQIEDRNVAIKILKKENIDDRKIRKFKKEAQLLSLLDDENIVKIYEVGEEQNLHYIVTEYIDGMTLKDYIRSCSPIPVDEIINLSKQILHGVKHAHDRGVVHKDIKSQNILLDENKNVKITDFGIADILDEDITRTQSLMGTPQYIAPEILNREALTAQSDLYSVGIVMYEMCTTHVPFIGEKAAYIMIKQMSQPLPSIITERPDIPQSLENIIIKATAKKLENRYKNAQEIIDDLNHVYDPDKLDADPLLLKDDLVKQDQLEKTIDIGREKLNFEELEQKIEQKNKAKKKQKRIIMVSIIVILLLACFFLLYFNKTTKLVMPNVVDKPQQTAIDTIKLLGINENNISCKYEHNDSVAANNVIRTEPPADSKIKTNTPITLYISEGVESKKIGNYIGQMAQDTKNQLEQEGFSVELVTVENDAKTDSVVGQSPGSGSFLKPGEKITLQISSGKKSIVVPNFTNMTKNEVDNWARTNAISVTYESTCNSGVEANHVISQNVGYNQEIHTGDQISIILSSGTCPVDTDNKDSEND